MDELYIDWIGGQTKTAMAHEILDGYFFIKTNEFLIDRRGPSHA